MSRPSKSMRNFGQRDGDRGDMGYRSLEVRASSLNVDARTIEATVSTETPVLMPDWSRMEMVPEVLQTKGAIFPESRQVPFLDSHNRGRVADQLGSARDIATKYNSLTARLHFSEAASNEFTKVREGHVTDVSAGYEVLKRVYVPKGETKDVNGRSYTGPVNVVTKWRLREVSLTPIGADAQAKLRGLDPAAFRFESPDEEFVMLKELRDWCVSRGMSKDLDDAAAQRWLVDYQTANPPGSAAPETETRSEPGTAVVTQPAAVTVNIDEVVQRALAAADAKRAEQQKRFAADVKNLCEVAGMPELEAECRQLDDLDAVRKHLVDTRAKNASKLPFGVDIKQTGSGYDDMIRDMGTSLTLRALNAATNNQKAIENVLPVEKRGKNHQRFQYATLFDMASDCVRAMGIDVRELSREAVAICAMFGPQAAGIRSAVPAYHTTGSFSNLTYDAINKSMMVGYTEAPSTWRGPMRQGASVPDFKTIHRLRMGAIPNLPVWNDNSNPERASLADAREYYAVEARSLEISFSYRLLINDDMDALSRVPSQMGQAAARTVNTVAWSIITSNPTMSDSVALFAAATGARKRTNLTTGSGAPSVSTVGTLTNLMRQMRGENTPEAAEGADIINLRPAYIIGPSALETTINQLVNSAYDPSGSVNNQVYNPTRVLTPVIEPILDASSTTAWYLAADTSQIDTVEVTFLQGQETPVVRQFMDERNLSQVATVLQSFGAKALNHRGLQKHAGA